MNVIAVVAQKGGVGKTTLTQCLAVEALRQGMAAAIIDTDPQRSAGEWGSQREQAGIDAPTVIPVGSRPLRSVIKDLLGFRVCWAWLRQRSLFDRGVYGSWRAVDVGFEPLVMQRRRSRAGLEHEQGRFSCGLRARGGRPGYRRTAGQARP